MSAEKLKHKKGCRVHPGTILYEGYAVSDKLITANVSIDKVRAMMLRFVAMRDEPVFFILEIPSRGDTETETSPGVVETLHKDVYYIDGLSKDGTAAVMRRAGGILVNDGMSSFGFGGHHSGDEIMFGQYNVLTVYTSHPEKYDDLFTAHGIKRNDDLVTAWDTFTPDTPGDCRLYRVLGKRVYDIPEMLKDQGMYFAERRELD